MATKHVFVQSTADKISCHMSSLGRLLNNESQIIKLHAVLQLHGGGNKQDALQDVKHALAIFMMGQGADLKDVSYVLEVLGRNAGLHALKKISEIHVVKDKISALHQLATILER